MKAEGCCERHKGMSGGKILWMSPGFVLQDVTAEVTVHDSSNTMKSTFLAPNSSGTRAQWRAKTIVLINVKTIFRINVVNG